MLLKFKRKAPKQVSCKPIQKRRMKGRRTKKEKKKDRSFELSHHGVGHMADK